MTSRNVEIKRLRKAGLTYAELGRHFGVSKERIRQLLNPKKAKIRPPKTMLTTTDVSQILGLHPNTVRRWTANGTLPAFRLNERGDRRYLRTEIEKFLNAQRTGK